MALDGYTVRAVGGDDGQLLHAIHGDPEVARWLRRQGESGPFSAQESRLMAQIDAAALRLAHGFGRWLVLDGGVPVGHGGLLLRTLEGHAEAEIAWAVSSAHWGRGVATGIGAAALAVAARRGIDRPIAFTRADNAASRRVMDKIGLSFERELEYAGWQSVLYRGPAAADAEPFAHAARIGTQVRRAHFW